MTTRNRFGLIFGLLLILLLGVILDKERRAYQSLSHSISVPTSTTNIAAISNSISIVDPPESPPSSPPVIEKFNALVKRDRSQIFFPDPSNYPRDMFGSLKFLMSLQQFVYCKTEERLGFGGDGGKWVCHPRVFLANVERCVIYSLGSSGDFSFEFQVSQIAPGCEIHTFDPMELAHAPSLPPNIHFHKYAIVPQREIDEMDTQKEGIMSLQQAMKRLGHKQLTVLKMDIEGGEFSKGFFDDHKDSIWRRIGQLMIEIHTENRFNEVMMIYERMMQSGLMMFHRELNPYGVGVFEFAFINPKISAEAYEIPYTPKMLADAEQMHYDNQKELYLMEFWSQENGWGLETYFFIDEPHARGCPDLEYLPGDVSNRYCPWNFRVKTRSGEDIPSGPSVIFISDKHQSLGIDVWLPGMVTDFPLTTGFHVWGEYNPSKNLPINVFYEHISEVKMRDGGLDFNYIIQNITDMGGWPSMVVIDHGNGYDEFRWFLDAFREFDFQDPPKTQVMIHFSACSRDHRGVSSRFELITETIKLANKMGFRMLSKEADVANFYPDRCSYYFLYST